MTLADIHEAAADGYTSGADAYARGRPDYPAEVAGWLRDALALGAQSTVLDLGAGTGKFTSRLVATGARVLAVEPVDAMRAKLAAAHPHVQAFAGTAEAIPLPEASVDAVVCAQAFHWFASRAALDAIARVLKPNGCLGLIWNMRDARVPWVARLDAIVNRHEHATPRYYTGAWRQAFPHARFGALLETHFSVGHTGAPHDVIVNRVRSTSFIAALPPEEQADVEHQLHALIADTPELTGQLQVTVPYETAAFWTKRLP
jgi:SAM-dependent methyltransferase